MSCSSPTDREHPSSDRLNRCSAPTPLRNPPDTATDAFAHSPRRPNHAPRTPAQMILVTEAVRGCLRDIMSAPQHPQNQQPHTAGHGHGYGAGHGDAAAEGGGLGGGAAGGSGVLSSLEVKLGLLAVAEALAFLHSAARLAHCGLSPQVGVTCDMYDCVCVCVCVLKNETKARTVCVCVCV